jgi:hypothetical protein
MQLQLAYFRRTSTGAREGYGAAGGIRRMRTDLTKWVKVIKAAKITLQ